MTIPKDAATPTLADLLALLHGIALLIQDGMPDGAPDDERRQQLEKLRHDALWLAGELPSLMRQLATPEGPTAGVGNPSWSRGFDAGVLCCLAVVAASDGPGSTMYLDIVNNCGPLKDLIAAAKRDGDTQLPHLRKIDRDKRERERRSGHHIIGA